MPKKPFDLPPHNLIEGFEAAARQLSFTKAADELFPTQSAVSRKFKGREDRLGMPLFERRPRSLTLTQAGATLYRPIDAVASIAFVAPSCLLFRLNRVRTHHFTKILYRAFVAAIPGPGERCARRHAAGG